MKSFNAGAGLVKRASRGPSRIGPRAMMSVRHYQRRITGDDMSIAGCSCRGSLAWLNKMRIGQAADALLEAEA